MMLVGVLKDSIVYLNFQVSQPAVEAWAQPSVIVVDNYQFLCINNESYFTVIL